MKSKVGKIQRVECRVAIPLNVEDFEAVDAMARNTLGRDAFYLECDKLNEMSTF